VETEVLGYSHQEIGSFLSDKWNLPDAICDAIKFHHTPTNSEIDKKLTSIVHLADYMTQKLQIGNFYWDENLQLTNDDIAALDFNSIEEAEEFIDGYKGVFEEESNTSIFT